MALSTTYSDYKKVSDIRLNKIDARRTLANTIERASTIVYTSNHPTMVAADYPLGIAAYDMELVKAYVAWEGSEGNDGTVAIEKWDDVGGTADDLMTDAVVTTGNAAAIYTLTPVTDGGQYITAGEKINMVIATCNGAVRGNVTLVFKLVDNVDNS